MALSVVIPLALSANVREYYAEIGFLNVASFSSQKWFGRATIGEATPSTLTWGLTDISDFLTMVAYATSLEDTSADKLMDVRHKWDDASAAIAINREWLQVERIPPS